jgi:hypothetical protein
MHVRHLWVRLLVPVSLPTLLPRWCVVQGGTEAVRNITAQLSMHGVPVAGMWLQVRALVPCTPGPSPPPLTPPPPHHQRGAAFRTPLSPLSSVCCRLLQLGCAGSVCVCACVQDWSGVRVTPTGTRLWWNWEVGDGVMAVVHPPSLTVVMSCSNCRYRWSLRRWHGGRGHCAPLAQCQQVVVCCSPTLSADVLRWTPSCTTTGQP